MVFQHVRATAHFARDVARGLQPGEEERSGPVPWPARSPDLIPLDSFLWGYVKDRLYFSDCPPVEEMEQRMCSRQLHRRWCVCIQKEGHFEPLL